MNAAQLIEGYATYANADEVAEFEVAAAGTRRTIDQIVPVTIPQISRTIDQIATS